MGSGLFSESNNAKSTPIKKTGSGLFDNQPRQNIEPEEQLGWSGVSHDISQAIQGIPSLIGKGYEEAKAIPGQDLNRIGKNLLAGVGEAGIGLLNAPHDIIKYLGEKKITPDWLNQYNETGLKIPFTNKHIPTHIGNLGIEEQLGLGQTQPGDELLRLLPGLIGGHKGFGKLSEPFSLAGKEKQLSNTLQEIKNIEEAHAGALPPGKQHGFHASQQFLDTAEGKINPETGKREGGLKHEIGNQFNELDKSFAGKTIEIPLKAPKSQLDELLSIAEKNGYMGEAPNQLTLDSFRKQAEEYLLKGKKTEVANAQDLYRKFRTLTMQATKDRSNAYVKGINPEAHHKWLGIAAAKEAEAERLQSLLKHANPEAFEQLQKVKHRWATEYAPLRENPLYNEMLKHGQTSKNIIQYLHGTTKGNEILNNIVKENPQLQQTLIGQQFSGKPANLAIPNELLDKYAQMNPYIAQLIEEQKGIKHLKETKIPKLEEAIKKSRERKIGRKGFYTGVGATGAALGLDAALGRNWKEDFPWLIAMMKNKK